uniref:uncharacterized protein LOC120955726 n=1 Tax=Anopheles coluzzii TaxID=1518534 RepID=UPI0020FFBD92|nr:uncharacterized protein LOC120955726 [Anopheles coluzzii]
MRRFFTIHKPPGVPHLALKLLHAVGIANGETFSHRFTAVYLLFIFFIAIPKLFCGYTSFEASVVGLAELFFQLNNFTGLLLVLVSSKQLQCLVRVGQTIADEVFQFAQADMRQLLTSHHKRMHTWTRYYCLVILYTVSIFATAPICATFWSYVRAAHRNTTAQYVLHMEEDFYGLQIRSSLRSYLMFAIPMVPMSYVCAYVGCAKIMIVFNFTSYCTVYFRLVTFQLQYQTRTVPSDRDSIITIVTMHQQALCCADLLETIVSPIMLMQIVLCVLMSSSMILYFTFAVSEQTATSKDLSISYLLMLNLADYERPHDKCVVAVFGCFDRNLRLLLPRYSTFDGVRTDRICRIQRKMGATAEGDRKTPSANFATRTKAHWYNRRQVLFHQHGAIRKAP